MTYYLVEISMGDTKIQGKAIYEYPTQREALAAYHKKMGTAIDSELYTSELILVTNSYGANIKRDFWEASASDTEQEETSEEVSE